MMKEIFRDIVNNTFEGVIIIGDDYRIKYVNRFASEITGFSNKEANDKFCYEVLRAKRCQNACPIKALKEGKRLGEFIVDIIAKDNSEKFIKTKVIGTHGYWVEIFQDVTREIELEKRIKEKYIYQEIITQDSRQYGAGPVRGGRERWKPAKLSHWGPPGRLTVGNFEWSSVRARRLYLHRLAIMSKDGDWIIREDEESPNHVLNVLPGFGAKYRFGGVRIFSSGTFLPFISFICGKGVYFSILFSYFSRII